MAATALHDLFDRAPAKRVLLGDKQRRPESATHIIEFPGGAIEVSRLDDGCYWAHIIVHRGHVTPADRGRMGARGKVINSRVDWAERDRLADIPGLPDEANLTQIAVLIRPEPPGAMPATAEGRS